jgi:FkbM family methyltransferase
MNQPIISSNGLLFLNVPSAQALLEEVVDGDCYGVESIPQNCRVLDLGACYGEFSLLASKRKLTVKAVEHSLQSNHILEANIRINRNPDIRVVRGAVVATETHDKVGHFYNPSHPAGSSSFSIEGEALLESVPAYTINQLTSGWDHWAIKMDIEGAERLLFDKPNWLMICDWLSMEFHNADGHHYSQILEKAGFTTEIWGGGSKQTRVKWDPSMNGGVILARKSKLAIDMKL